MPRPTVRTAELGSLLLGNKHLSSRVSSASDEMPVGGPARSNY